MFASHDCQVIGVDVDERIVQALNKGNVIIKEPNLDELVKKAVEAGNLAAKTIPAPADAFIIAVPTPITLSKKADMSYVIAATESIIPFIQKGNIIVLESTSPVGTVEELMLPILVRTGLKIGEELFVAHSPERVLPGQILRELVENNRIVGGINKKSAELTKELYQSFVKGEILLTDARTAELCKLMENTYRDVNIALANELAKICEHEEINVWEVIELCNKHPRVNLHRPGPGVGGHCLAVDPWFIVERNSDIAKIIHLSRQTNDSMPTYLTKMISAIFSGQTEGKKIVVLGGTYKADVDDTRESPALELIDLLEKKGYKVSLVDPYINEHRCLAQKFMLTSKESDLVVLAVGHKKFASINLDQLYNNMRIPNILDACNFWDGNQLTSIGFNYYQLGNGQTFFLNSGKEAAATVEN
jgi:UDP-N-acetyl-D-mannosaminuronic acid dehydrogenase